MSALAYGSDEGQFPDPPNQKQFGYAFDRAPVLAQQLLYGRAHGVGLLAAACDSDTPIGIETRVAYAKWLETQIHAIAKMEHDLALWYFASDAQNATYADIIRAMHLPSRLSSSISDDDLSAACATFAQMLEGERYDLSALLAKILQEVSPQLKTPDPVPVATAQ